MPQKQATARFAKPRLIWGAKAKAALSFIVEPPAKLDLSIVPCSCRPGTEGTPACNYGRQCGVLTVGGVDVAPVMIAAGFAVPYHCGPTRCPKLPRPWCDAQ